MGVFKFISAALVAFSFKITAAVAGVLLATPLFCIGFDSFELRLSNTTSEKNLKSSIKNGTNSSENVRENARENASKNSPNPNEYEFVGDIDELVLLDVQQISTDIFDLLEKLNKKDESEQKANSWNFTMPDFSVFGLDEPNVTDVNLSEILTENFTENFTDSNFSTSENVNANVSENFSTNFTNSSNFTTIYEKGHNFTEVFVSLNKTAVEKETSNLSFVNFSANFSVLKNETNVSFFANVSENVSKNVSENKTASFVQNATKNETQNETAKFPPLSNLSEPQNATAMQNETQNITAKNATKPKPQAKGTTPRLVIIIDDMSTRHETEMLKSVGLDLTPSFFPPTSRYPNTPALAREFRSFMVHLPLKALRFRGEEPHTLPVGASSEQIEERVAFVVRCFGRVKFLNNHTGSAFTADTASMRRLFASLKIRNIAFVDSMTHAHSKGTQVALELGLKFAKRNVFLDNERSETAVLNQIRKAVLLARKNGIAIAIGHPHVETFNALKLAKKSILKDVEVVYIDEIF